jgi:cytoskeletal protein CcmA (bactofilin family)
MFGRKDSAAGLGHEQVGTILGKGSVVDGPLSAEQSTRIDGTVNGDVKIKGSLIVGQEGKITGAVSCVNAYIAGEITGNITAPEGKVEISDTGKVIGDVACKGIVIDENAVFQGQCDMTGVDKTAEAASDNKPAEEKTAEEKTEKNTEEKK